MKKFKEKQYKFKSLFTVLILFNISFSQLNIQTLSTIRNGETLHSKKGKIPSYYTDILLEYRYKGFLAGVRGEGFSSPELNNQYDHINQRYLQYSWKWVNAEVGNFYEIFGKGLILRGFELPGFIYEDQIKSTQYRIIRDFDGFKIKLNPGPLKLTLIDGETIDPLLDPKDKNRRSGRVTGGEASISLPGSISLGTAYLEQKNDITTKLISRQLSWSADPLLEKIGAEDLSIDFYAEYANDGNNFFSKKDNGDPEALYLSGSMIWNYFGTSVEYKDYHQFDFGINDPPPLIRENTEVLLNRSTHILNAFAEKGYQIEFFVSPFASTRVIANYSKARNDYSDTYKPLFQERYIGVEYTGDKWSVRSFFDSGQDDLVSEYKRITTGIAPEYSFSNGSILGFDIQWQRIRRGSPPFFDYNFTNFYTSLKLMDWHSLSFTVSSERSSDPDVTKSEKYFINTSVGWQPIHNIGIQFFAGKRRGGSACDHGYCIEVLDFEGVEMRIETQW